MLKKFSLNASVSVVTMFGYFGVVALIVGSPLIFMADQVGFDSFAFPRSAVAVFGIIGNALIGSVLSDILLAKAVILLNPVTVSIGLSMSMPLSLLMDSVVVRSSCILAIFLQFTAVCLISIDNHRQKRL
jgi:drug/metabolite transporter (DMT)-like permease